MLAGDSLMMNFTSIFLGGLFLAIVAATTLAVAMRSADDERDHHLTEQRLKEFRHLLLLLLLADYTLQSLLAARLRLSASSVRRIARKSFTLVSVGPVTTESPKASKKP